MSGPDLITIASADLTARVNPLGAELWSLTDRHGREYLTDADPAFWTGRAPLLFPVVGALNGGRFRLGDREYALPKHGFARTSRFDVVEATAGSARFRLVDSDATRAVYPFAFALDVTYRLDGLTLAMTAAVANRGDRPLPFSFGFHPAFAWPLPGGGDKLSHTLVFERDEPAAIRRIDAAGLLATVAPSPVQGRVLPLAPELFEADALIWDELASRRLAYRGAGETPRLDIAFPDTPHLGVWQKPGAAYLCIEPWQGHADPAGYSGDLLAKLGIVTLAPGLSRSFRMDVAVQPG